MAKVRALVENNDVLAPMGEIPPGVLGVIVKSPIERQIGLYVLGGSCGMTYCLSSGESWGREASANKVRILSSEEKIELSNR